MTELQLGGQTIRYDRAATAKIYQTLEHGEAESCGCHFCRDFAALNFPASFRARSLTPPSESSRS